jgi:hypothetical protein
MKPRFIALVIFVAAFLAMRRADAVEHNVAGSAQIDYLFAPTAPSANANAGTNGTFDGFTMEAAVKLAVDVSPHLSSNIKLCFGCHGFEADMAYFDLRAADELNVRIGRFSPSFGAFNVRHDPANHKFSDKPLPYDMGRMLRKNVWNNGVLPAPFPDNGVELNGAHWFGDVAQLDYAAYATMGFRNDLSNPTDINFAEAHIPNYFVDNNGRPATGARIAMNVRTGAMSDASLGASGLFGTYDPNNKLTYAILGADFSLRIGRTNFRMEYLVRRTEMDVSNPAIFKYVVVPNGDFFVKHGAYAEVEQPLVRDLDLLLRVDGMFRVGNVLATTPLAYRSSVIRESLGLAYAIDRNFRLKSSGELWEFSDPDTVSGRHVEVGIHCGAVATF